MADETSTGNVEPSIFQVKYDEFVDDALGALPEYEVALRAAKALDEKTRLERFQSEVQVQLGWESSEKKNPGAILPGVLLSDAVWNQLSDTSQQAIQEHLRILSVCCFMETGVSGDAEAEKPAWMEDMMKEMKEKLESLDMDALFKKFSSFFTSDTSKDEKADADADEKAGAEAGAKEPSFSFPQLPEKFLKGQLARLAQEIVKDITPEDLGITSEQIAECEKNPSQAFTMLFSTFTKNPTLLQRTIAKIGKRLQQKIVSGAIRPQEIAREAEELMKEFSSHSSFVEMMSGLKSAFGMEDMETARQAGRESSARMSIVRDRLRKKLDKKNAASPTSVTTVTPSKPSNPSKPSQKKK